MFRQMIFLRIGVVLFSVLTPLGEAGIENQTLSDSEGAVTDINSHFSHASQTTKLQNDLKELCVKNFNYIDSGCLHMKPMDCSDIYLEGERRDGLYYIWPKSRMSCGPLRVYCDMESDGGGWTVIQRRGDYGSRQDHFYREWNAYKTGFGNKLEDFWIGNDNIFVLTNQRPYELRVNLTAWDGETAYAIYDEFWISDEVQNYTLHLKRYSGTAGDSLMQRHDGWQFSTTDRGNDGSSNKKCAALHKGAWWYQNCMDSNLNGFYMKGNTTEYAVGVVWRDFKGPYYSLRDTVMKIRPAGFTRM